MEEHRELELEKAEAHLHEAEAEIKQAATELERAEHDLERAWVGEVPIWPFDRPPPPDLEAFLDGERLRVKILYPQAFPMVAPIFYPVEPDPDPSTWTLHDWHLNGDGSLCLLQSVSAWRADGTAAETLSTPDNRPMDASRSVTAARSCGVSPAERT